MIPAENASTYPLPHWLTPAAASALGLVLTRRKRATGFVRFASLALIFCSWSAGPRKLTLQECWTRLTQLRTQEDLLAVLGSPPAFDDYGGHVDVPRSTRQFARQTANSLEKERENIPSWHAKLLKQLEFWLQSSAESQKELTRLIDAEVRPLCPRSVIPTQLVQSLTGLVLDNFMTKLRTVQDNQTIKAFATSPGAAPELTESQRQVATAVVRHLAEIRRNNQLLANAGKETGASPKKPEQSRGPMAVSVKKPEGPACSIFDPHQATDKLVKLGPFIPGEGNTQQRKGLEAMSMDSGMRALAQTDLGKVQALRARFPHFKEVLDFVEASLALAACGSEGTPARVPPILLRGKPGCGKTYFAQELAKALSTNFIERDLSVVTEAFVLTGMDAGWKNAKPGVVFDALVSGPYANPLICLNEVDKARNSGQNNSPMAALYALLEPASARMFTDEFIPVPVDSSRVIWVLTANEGEIPEPILSRLEVFDIPQPNEEQNQLIAQSVWQELLATAFPQGHPFEPELSTELLEKVCTHSPRVMRRVLLACASQAALEKRKALSETDLHAIGHRYTTKNAPRAMGFL